VLICSKRKVLLAGCCWLICSERKVLADKPSKPADHHRQMARLHRPTNRVEPLMRVMVKVSV
jgi:hypothetical protein